MAAAHQETMFAAPAQDVLGDAVPSPQKPASDVGLLRQRVIMQLLEQVPMVPGALQAMFSHLMQSGVLTSEAVSPELKLTSDTATSAAIRGSETSRFDQDFERLELLGRGAFGEVWRCRHRLDGREYAVKAVQYHIGTDAGQMEQHVLREASTWACLSHPNILRYHSSWAEVQQKHIMEGEHNSEFLPFPTADELVSALSMDTSDPGTADLADEWSFEESDGGVVFEASNLAAKSQSPAPQHAVTPPDSVVFTATATPPRPPSALLHQGTSVVSGCRATLYLQAELCRKDTLAAWIAQRNAAKASGLVTLRDLGRWAGQGLDIFRQIVVGLAHLHARSCAHRDVKPSNILFGCDGNVRLGDFGLAKFLEDTPPMTLHGDHSSSSPQQGKSPSGVGKLQRTSAVGTSAYASPEQLEGRPYGVETDVYALGMILAELLCPVSTHMERAILLEGVRNGRRIFGEAASALPIAARLALAMTSPDPMQRPLMREILEAYPEVEREVILCFSSETALLNIPSAAASPTTTTASVGAAEKDSSIAAVDGFQKPPRKVFAARCNEAAKNCCQSKKEPACCNSSIAFQSTREWIPLLEQQAPHATEKTEEVMDHAKIVDTVKEFSFAPAARAAGAAHVECWYWPPFALPIPRAAPRARAGHVELDKTAQGHHCTHSVPPKIAGHTTATWVPFARGHRGRRQHCNGRGAPPIKHLSHRGRWRSGAALPPYSVVGVCSS